MITNKRPTPETDALWLKQFLTISDALDLACKLGRERDEVIRIQKTTEQVWHGAEAELEKTREERDQLRAENTTLRRLLVKHECPYGNKTPEGVCNLGYPGCTCADDVFSFEDEYAKQLVAERTQLRKVADELIVRLEISLAICERSGLRTDWDAHEEAIKNDFRTYNQLPHVIKRNASK